MIIGISGFIGSGKDTVAEYLVDNHDFERISFASSLKDACSKIFHWERDMLEGLSSSHRAEREKVDEWWAKKLGIPNFSPRFALQYMGTDVLRHHFHDDIWILSLEKFIHDCGQHKRFVISDMRFPNEAKMIKRVNGLNIEVVRGPAPEWAHDAVIANTTATDSARTAFEKLAKEKGIHISEYARLGLVDYDVSIDNNKSLDDLYSEIETRIIPLID